MKRHTQPNTKESVTARAKSRVPFGALAAVLATILAQIPIVWAVSDCSYCDTFTTDSRPPSAPSSCSCRQYTFPHCKPTSEQRVCVYNGTTTCSCENADGTICRWSCWTCTDRYEDCRITS
jgi:hypothetical protein